jgi:dienelactone hydrolase
VTPPREDVRFPSGSETLDGWLYRPANGGAEAPCVVMAHGFGALKEARLDAYAERFADAGLAVLVFDYRCFGDSTGEPRNLLDIGGQHDDWRAAIAHARGLAGVDPERIALWGSSFSGGHVMAVGSGDDRVAAIVAQVPHTSGLATLRMAGPANAARMTVAGLIDVAESLVGRGPHYMPTVGPPGTLAAMNSPDAEPGYSGLYPEGFEWRNEVPARIGLRIAAYSPGKRAAAIRCPLLVQVGRNDVVTPPAPAIAASKRAPHGELIEYDLGHFDVYVGEPFERVVTDQLEFFKRHLN